MRQWVIYLLVEKQKMPARALRQGISSVVIGRESMVEKQKMPARALRRALAILFL